METAGLRQSLDALCSMYPIPRRDPVEFLHRYEREEDKEVVGFISSSFSFGNARAFGRILEGLLSLLGASPRDFLLRFSPQRDGDPFLSIGHRWVRGRDVVRLLSLLGLVLVRHGSLKALFLKGFRRTDPHVGPALARFVGEFRALSSAPSSWGRPGDGAFFFPSPGAGSACKRMNLFLRWMVRDGNGVDAGLWPEVPRSRLIIPLDTHLYRLSEYLGLTRRKSKDWKTAVEITGAFRRIEPRDPLKYDYALCHHGMEYCSGPHPSRCRACPLRVHCRAGRAVTRGVARVPSEGPRPSRRG